MSNKTSSEALKIEKTRANQAITIAIIGAIVSIATIFKDVFVPKAEKSEVALVQQSIGDTVNDKINSKLKIVKGNIIYESIPIGTVIASSLSFEQLCTQMDQPYPSQWSSVNSDQYTWVPADGRNIAGSKYDIISSKVPDLRGVFLRGRNQFDKEEKEKVKKEHKDMSGLREIGHFQPDNSNGFLSIDKVAIYEGSANNSTVGPLLITHDNKNQGKKNFNFGKTGETNPRNKAINYFIKIN